VTLIPGNRRGFSVRDLLVLLVKLAVTILLVAFVYSQQSLDQIQAAFQNPSWGWLLVSLVVYSISAFCGALQWSWILKAAGIEAPGREIRRIYFIGLFFNNFLPANIGGDAYKIVDLGRRENRAHGVFCSTLMDRLIGLTALTFLAVVFLTVAAVADIPLPYSALLLIPATFALAVVLALLLSKRLGQWLPGVFHRLGLAGPARQLEKITEELAHFRPRVRWLNMIFLFSLLIQFLRMATHVFVAIGLGLTLNPEQVVQLMVLVPMLALSLILPITINGIGLRETVASQLLVFSGLAAPQGVALEVAAYLVQVVFSLQGGVLLWLGRWGRRTQTAKN
jgi:glycosyltransferase 2 family protein